MRKKRSIDVETVLGDIKRNLGFTRFTLRGLEEVTLEWRLVVTGHNIRKLFLTGCKKGRSHGIVGPFAFAWQAAASERFRCKKRGAVSKSLLIQPPFVIRSCAKSIRRKTT